MKKLMLLVVCLFSGAALNAMECPSGKCSRTVPAAQADATVSSIGQGIRGKYGCPAQPAQPAQAAPKKVSAISAAITAKYGAK